LPELIISVQSYPSKIYALDSTGKLPPLKPDLELRIRPLVQKIQSAISENDIDKLKPLVNDNGFRYVAFDGTVHHGFPQAIISDDLEKITQVRLRVIYLIDEMATVHLNLTLVGDKEHSAKFVINNFQLTQLDFAPKPLAVMPQTKLTTTWAEMKNKGN
jgi:hypothetical protein